VDCSTKDLFLANRITNISRGGFFIEANLPLHSEIDLCFRIPESQMAIDAKGRVIWTYDMKKDTAQLVSGSGIKFTEMAQEDRTVLEDYLRKLSTGSPRAATRHAEAV
jgi:Tfp pilus assembly protein PilZ